tara:strand:+ start:3193 stop:5448 length:2256 start_codon:yes stop_codon:yes gene_type:complete
MASSYTVNNGIEKPAAGEQEGAWGGTLNTNFDIIDRVLSGVGSISLSGTTHTLTTTDGTLTDGMYKVLLFTGALGANNTVTISPNDQDKLYFVVNNTTDSGSDGPYSVIVKQGTGATVTVANGAFNMIYADGAGSGAAVTSLFANDVVFGDDLILDSDAAVVKFGANSEVTLTHVHNSGLTLSAGANATALNITSTEAGSGVGPTINLTRDSASPAASDQLGYLNFVGEDAGSNQTNYAQVFAVITDPAEGSEDGKLSFYNITNGSAVLSLDLTGSTATFANQIIAAELDISGNIDIDGTANLDIVDIDGAVQIDSTVTVGVDDTGYDVKFFGDTASAYMLWDTSTDDLVLAGAAGIDLAGDLDVDGTANLDVVDIDGAVDMASTLTLAGNADFNGDLDVDGTANLDIVDVDGAANFAADVTFADGADIITATAGSANVRVGANAGIAIDSGGHQNVAVGDSAGRAITSGDNNVAVGYNALNTGTTASNNVAVGAAALTANTSGAQNSASGYASMTANTTGLHNTGTGYATLATNTEGNYNTATGSLASYTNLDGIGNTATGYVSLYTNSTGDYNTADGYQSLYAITTGSQNVGIGYVAGVTLTTGSNNICIGANAQATAADVSNEITLGNASTATLRCQVARTGLSDRRDKQDIEDLPVGLDFINSLRPVKFTWNMRDGGKVGVEEAGFIAQDLDASQQEFDAEEYLQLVLKNNPDKLEAAPGKLIPMLVKAVQELSAEVKELKEMINVV